VTEPMPSTKDDRNCASLKNFPNFFPIPNSRKAVTPPDTPVPDGQRRSEPKLALRVVLALRGL